MGIGELWLQFLCCVVQARFGPTLKSLLGPSVGGAADPSCKTVQPPPFGCAKFGDPFRFPRFFTATAGKPGVCFVLSSAGFAFFFAVGICMIGPTDFRAPLRSPSLSAQRKTEAAELAAEFVWLGRNEQRVGCLSGIALFCFVFF